MIRMSALERVLNCPASESLPQSASTSEYASLGTAIHRACELAANGASEEEALAVLPPDVRDAFHAEDLQALEAPSFDGITDYVTECALWYNVATGIAWAGCNGPAPADFDTESPFVIPGHADYIGIGPGVVAISDIKSGRAVKRPRDNEQLRGYALAAARAFGVSRAIVAIKYVHDGRVYNAGPDVLDDLDLDGIAHDLRQMVIRAGERGPDGKLELHEGPWCGYCPAYNSCPAKASLAIAVSRGEDALLKRVGVTKMTRADGVKLVRAIEMIEPLLKRLRATAFAMADGPEGPLEDPETGERWGRQIIEGNEKLDAKVVRDVLEELYGPAVALDALLPERGTKSGISKALKKVSPRGTLAANEEKVLAEVRKRGGASRDHKPTYGWMK